jgi:hypothetical protein
MQKNTIAVNFFDFFSKAVTHLIEPMDALPAIRLTLLCLW